MSSKPATVSGSVTHVVLGREPAAGMDSPRLRSGAGPAFRNRFVGRSRWTIEAVPDAEGGVSAAAPGDVERRACFDPAAPVLACQCNPTPRLKTRAHGQRLPEAAFLVSPR